MNGAPYLFMFSDFGNGLLDLINFAYLSHSLQLFIDLFNCRITAHLLSFYVLSTLHSDLYTLRSVDAVLI